MFASVFSRARLPALHSQRFARSVSFDRSKLNQALRLGKVAESASAAASAGVPKGSLRQESVSTPVSTQALPAPESAKIFTLSNGIRVAVTENYAPVSGLGVFVDVGSRWEEPNNNGICHFLERMSMKSTQSMTTAALVRAVASRGAGVAAVASRDSMFFSAECTRDNTDALLNVLRDISLYPELNDWEIQDMVEEYTHQVKEKERNPEADIMDAIHAAAYGNTGLGLSVQAPLGHLKSFTPSTLRNFLSTHFTPDRLVLSAVGVNPDAFLQSAEKLFGSVAKRSDQASIARPAVRYVGGDVRSHYKDDNALTHLAVAFETANWHENDMVPMAVLQMMMGGGASFSAGGPGKGMHSRLYERVLNRYHFAQSALSFNAIYDDTAIFGIYGSADPAHAEDLAHVISDQALEMAAAPEPAELARAKNQLKSSIFMHLESRLMAVEDQGRQTLVYGKVHTPQQLAQRIDAVTAGDIQRVARNMLKTAPSIAAVGDLSTLPRYDIIANYIRQNAAAPDAGSK